MRQSFPELLQRAPRDKRTDGVKALIALLVLDATTKESAVDTQSVASELRRHLRNAVPGNLSDTLRKGGANIECITGEGRGLRWRLTTAGRLRLEKLLKLSPDEIQEYGPSQGAGHGYDLAIVCAVHDPELKAVLRTFNREHAWKEGPSSGQPHIYKTTSATTGAGTSLRIIAGAPTYMGLTATAIVATQMLLMFKPRMIVMVGIAAGTKTGGRAFGDILVADPSVDYASGKVTFIDGAETFQPDPCPLPIDARLRTLVQEDKRTRDGLDGIQDRWPGKKPVASLNIHIGPLGAADQVVDSAARVAEVQRHWRKLIGVEMETYALYRAAHEAPTPRPLHISFKSVCDFAAAKSDDWQEYAAFTAAAYCESFILKNWESVFRK